MSKTMIAAFVSIVAGLFVAVGQPLPDSILADLTGNLETILGSIMVVYGILMGALRKLTSTPLVSLLRKKTVEVNK